MAIDFVVPIGAIVALFLFANAMSKNPLGFPDLIIWMTIPFFLAILCGAASSISAVSLASALTVKKSSNARIAFHLIISFLTTFSFIVSLFVFQSWGNWVFESNFLYTRPKPWE